MSGEMIYPRGSGAYFEQLRALLPRGAAWICEAGTTLGKLLSGLAVELARIDARGIDLIEEADPRTAYELLPDWERVAGLPDTCTGAPETARERQAALHQKLTSTGGQTIAYFIDLAAKAGFLIEIDEHRPAVVGMACDAELYGEAWAFAWTVRVLPFNGTQQGELPVAVAEAGDPVGIPLRGWGALDLECLIGRARPAHTTVLFAYEVEPEPALWFDFTR
ncbi:YmfQ family protein [Novosphingobium sp. NDB2Meth1]|uniref:YmfQ family protein n=1 Tax=Novosphingobium sp. NDB2Meth1 TaxID=1892847 RepID=UPI0009F83B68|nr:putative phage tail protein [Novosphingobium sp. NDB2Meth1]